MTRKSRKTETRTEQAGCLEGGAPFLPTERLIGNGSVDPSEMGMAVPGPVDPSEMGMAVPGPVDPSEMGIVVSDWYHADHRKLPWRETRDPYRILVSEIMLQQTRVETVTGYWKRFLEAFPDAAALADAAPEQVMNLWQGLGYYSRGRNLQKAAQMVSGEFHGQFPDRLEDIRRLPGVGPYTAGAVASIAFGIPVPAVDGNVQRVAARLFLLEGDMASPAAKKEVEKRVSAMIPSNRASDFCQGMMELGAMVCTPTSPHCAICPLTTLCLARQTGKQGELPYRKAKAAPVASRQIVCLIRDDAGRFLMQYRQKGLLSGLWGLPHYESDDDRPDPDLLAERLGLFADDEREKDAAVRDAEVISDGAALLLVGPVGKTTHVFTHRIWNMEVWSFAWLKNRDRQAFGNGFAWVQPERMMEIPIPEAFLKVFRMMRDDGVAFRNE